MHCDVLMKNNSANINQKKPQVLTTEILLVKNIKSPKTMTSVFCYANNPFKLREKSILQ